MSFNNFKPELWAANILTDLDENLQLDKDCNHNYDGEVKKAAKVKILGLGDATMKPYKGGRIGDPETLQDTSITMDIDKQDYLFLEVGDIDKIQANPNLSKAVRGRAVQSMAEKYESYIAKEALNAGKMSEEITISTEITDQEENEKLIANEIDKGLLYLRNNNVPYNRRTVIELTPDIADLFTNRLIALKTQNDDLIKQGIIGTYKHAYVKMVNNLYQTKNNAYCMIRTCDAIAAGKQIDELEPVRPSDMFADCLKGLLVCGTKMVRPKECYTMKIKL